jgi:hypothetical protein
MTGAIVGAVYAANEAKQHWKRIKEIDAMSPISLASPVPPAQGNALASGPQSAESDNPLAAINNWVKEHPRVAGAVLATLVIPIPFLSTAAGWYAGQKILDNQKNNKQQPPQVTDGEDLSAGQQVIGVNASAVTDDDSVGVPPVTALPSGSESHNPKVPNPLERLLNWAERHPRLVAGAGSMVLTGPLVGGSAVVGLMVALPAVAAAHAVSKLTKFSTVEAHAKMHENIAAENIAQGYPNRAEIDMKRAQKVRHYKIPTI